MDTEPDRTNDPDWPIEDSESLDDILSAIDKADAATLAKLRAILDGKKD